MEPARRRVPLRSFSPEYVAGITQADTAGIVDLSPEPCAAAATEDAAASGGPAAADLPSDAAPAGDGGNFFCRVSNARFESAAALRQHFHTDWYRYNLRLASCKLAPLSEAAFDALVEQNGIDEELSGSDDSSDEDEGEGSRDGAPRSSNNRVLMRDADGGIFYVWRAALGGARADEPTDPLAALCALCSAPAPTWAVVLCRGGHFAAAVFEIDGGGAVGGGGGAPTAAAQGVRVVAHRCYHRYVTRRKAGGRQSVADASKSIKSAGSSIRRHNEAELAREIRDLLASWAGTHLATASAIYVHAPGPANAAAVFASGGPFKKGDPRLRGIPFSTARPTLAEATRAALNLSRAEYIDPAELIAAKAAAEARQRATAAAAAAAAEAAEAEAEAAAAAAARRAAADEAAAAASAAMEAEAEAMPSDLHVAAEAGDAQRVQARHLSARSLGAIRSACVLHPCRASPRATQRASNVAGAARGRARSDPPPRALGLPTAVRRCEHTRGA